MPLSALRILRHQRFDRDLRIPLCQLLQNLDTVGFVVLDCQNSDRIGEQLQQNLQTRHHLLRLLYHSSIVAGQIRFTLCTVSDDIIDLLRLLRRQFDMRGKTRAAHSDDSGFADNFPDVFCRQLLKRCFRYKLHFLIQAVILHHDAHDLITGHYPSRFNRFYGTRNRGIDRRRNKTAALGDFLAGKHPVTLGNDRLGRCADMLRKRIHHLPFRQYFLYRFSL